ncbi:MAG: DUF308 domain-containing protein [Ignavibacteriales bacterium]|nr:DUF308 domain-containing protein [Ignavibacteriales bacterium]
MGSPLAGGLAVVVLIGIALVIGGVSRIIGAFRAGSFGQGALAFIGGIITFVAGLAMTGRPGIGLTTLTLILGVYLVVDGISSAILAIPREAGEGLGLDAVQRRHGPAARIPAAPRMAAVGAVGYRCADGGQPPVQRVLHDLDRLRRAEPWPRSWSRRLVIKLSLSLFPSWAHLRKGGAVRRLTTRSVE